MKLDFKVMVFSAFAVFGLLPMNFKLVANEPKNNKGVLSREETISLEMPGEDALTLMRSIADLYGLNLIVSDTLENYDVSLKMREVSWREVFDYVLNQGGNYWVQKGNAIHIGSFDEFQELGGVVYTDAVIVLNYLDVEDIIPLLEIYAKRREIINLNIEKGENRISYRAHYFISRSLEDLIRKLDADGVYVAKKDLAASQDQ
ncbi:MAG: hypothetical protein F6K19_42865 [Cyanothece sp. SIO1E1]|nr:hypothetical protein [Cyanothece sp. SIO1E1]